MSRVQRLSLAVLLTVSGIAALEATYFSDGSSLLLEVGYFVIPAIVAAIFFRTLKDRVVAFVLLTLSGFLAATAIVSFYLAD